MLYMYNISIDEQNGSAIDRICNQEVSMAHAPRRAPSRADLALSRVVTSLAAALAIAAAGLNLLSADDSVGGTVAAAVTAATALAYGIGMIALKLRGDFILGLFGYWWPFALPDSDEMARSIRQQAFGFSYLVILSVVLVVIIPVFVAVTVFEPLAAGLAGLLPAPTASDLLACTLGLLILLAVLPQAYLAWTLVPLDEADELEERA
jgi:hypothetical protein